MLLVSNGMRASAQQDATSQYFPSTGHNISGAFWTYYQRIPNAAYVFGAPITEQFTDTQSGRVIQYFQRARFEYYPENPIDQRVKLSPTGQQIFQHSKLEGKLDIFTPIGCRSYPDTGFALCYAFLEFFDANGGETIFGKPVSPFVFYNGRIVQYFERARFDWFPENPEGEKVVLAEVGRIYFDIVPEDANRLQPVRAENTPGNVRALFPKAFTWKAVTAQDDIQTVYVVLQDQTLTPIADATTIVTITWPQGNSQSVAQTTDTFGVAIVPLQVQNQPHGSVVLIDVEVQYMGLSKKTQTSFRVW
jgi:hypothetical protein